MPLKMFHSIKAVNALTKDVEANLAIYKDKDSNFSEFLAEQKCKIIDPHIDESALGGLICKGGTEHDFANARLLWDVLKIPPRIARESRLWVYLTHSVGLDYTRARWPLGSDSAKNLIQIKRHYLADNTSRSLEKDNALSRLWMSAYIASKVESMSHETALSLLLNYAELNKSILDRPTILRSVHVLDAVMVCAKRILDQGNKDFFAYSTKHRHYHQWFMAINLEGGQKLLDAMDRDELQGLVDKLADEAQKNPTKSTTQPT